ncbi:hypothetical protein COD91_02715 [Bacillus cereus]|nr:hypothetical protein COD91_02715 [Bacillus cereus]
MIPSFKFNLLSINNNLENAYQITRKNFTPYILIIITCDSHSFCLYFRLLAQTKFFFSILHIHINFNPIGAFIGGLLTVEIVFSFHEN